MKTNLEKIERIMVIIGALFGVIAFFWQLYDSYAAKQEKIKVGVYFDQKYSEDKLQSLSGIINIVNIAQKPVYIRRIYIDDETHLLAQYNWDILESEPEAIEPGANRIYHLDEIDYQSMKEAQSNQSSFRLVIESNDGTELVRNSLDKCFAEIVGIQDYRVNNGSSNIGIRTRTFCAE